MTKKYNYSWVLISWILIGFIFLLGIYLIQFKFQPKSKDYVLKLEKEHSEFIDSIHVAISPLDKIKGIWLFTNLKRKDSVSFQFMIPEKVEILNPEASSFIKLKYLSNGTKLNINPTGISKYGVCKVPLKIIDNNDSGEYLSLIHI